MNNEEKFMLLYEKYRRLLFAIGKSILRDDADIDDALQQCWVAISKNLNKLDPARESRTRNYCCIVMKHAAMHVYKTRSEDFKANKAGAAIFSLDEHFLYDRKDDIPEECGTIADIAAADDPSVDETIAGFEELRLAGEILKELTPEERNIFILRHYYGHSNKEIEEMLGLKDGSAAWRLQNSKRKIATIIKKEGMNDETGYRA
jgi:RNA polymerase sigma-70 factor (ECF subfamily)